MSRIVTLSLNVQLIMVVDEGVEIQEIVSELEYNFLDTTTKADVLDQTILGMEIIDSR
jgi:hypothetical protein